MWIFPAVETVSNFFFWRVRLQAYLTWIFATVGTLVQILVKTDVTRYLEFKAVDGSFVVHESKVYKVPSTSGEALKSSLMGMLEKRRCGKFLEYVGEYDENDPKTYKGMKLLPFLALHRLFLFLINNAGLDLKKQSARDVFNYFGLKPDTIDFLGHAMALYFDDT